MKLRNKPAWVESLAYTAMILGGLFSGILLIVVLLLIFGAWLLLLVPVALVWGIVHMEVMSNREWSGW